MDDRSAFAGTYITELTAVLQAMPLEAIGDALAILDNARTSGRCVFVAGNGGSASTASHMANDFMKTITKTGGTPLETISLSDNVPLLTAIANDVSFDAVFSAQLKTLAQKEDVLIVISGSGNSKNLIDVIKEARIHQMKVIGFLGMDGGLIKDMVDTAIVVPSHDYGPIEDVHLILNHLITAWFLQKGPDHV